MLSSKPPRPFGRAFFMALLLTTAASAPAFADPIVVTTTNDANTLATTLLAGGSGITLNNAVYTGAATASGTFTGGTGVVGFQSGIVLTSGNAPFVSGPNTGNASVDNLAAGTALIAGSFNASLLDITFTPSGNQVEFSYVFGSEEYNDFVNSSFNDSFKFLVNGTNFALIPNTNTPVAINDVNNGNATQGNVGTGPCENCAFYIDNATNGGAGLNTQLDGLTTVLSFIAPVNANVENTLQLVIADVADKSLDSAVFLAGGTFQVCGDPPLPPCGGGTDGGTDGTGGDQGGSSGGEVPEPATLGLLGLGLAGLAARGRKTD